MQPNEKADRISPTSVPKFIRVRAAYAALFCDVVGEHSLHLVYVHTLAELLGDRGRTAREPDLELRVEVEGADGDVDPLLVAVGLVGLCERALQLRRRIDSSSATAICC